MSDGRIYDCCSKQQVTYLVDKRKARCNRSYKCYKAYKVIFMYDLYVTECEKENLAPGKEKYYYNVFSTKFNSHFKQPSKDTCQTCDDFQIKI